MFELFGLIAGAFVLVPILIAAGLVIAVLCGFGHVFGLIWDLFWGVFGVVFGLLFVFGLIAFGVIGTLLSIVF